MKKYFECEQCGPIAHAMLDGYPVGERILEDVQFVCTIGRGGKITVVVAPEAVDYFATLNQRVWLKRVRDFANQDGCDSFECPKCKQPGGFVQVVDSIHSA